MHLSFQTALANLRDLGATDARDYTGKVQDLIDDVNSTLYDDPTDCCNYRYQLLDQYCATRSPVSWTDLYGATISVCMGYTKSA